MNSTEKPAVGAPVEASVRPMAVAWLYPDGRPCTLSWAGQDEARMHEMAPGQSTIMVRALKRPRRNGGAGGGTGTIKSEHRGG